MKGVLIIRELRIKGTAEYLIYLKLVTELFCFGTNVGSKDRLRKKRPLQYVTYIYIYIYIYIHPSKMSRCRDALSATKLLLVVFILFIQI